MVPPENFSENTPCLFYNRGGWILDLIVTMILFPWLFLVKNYYGWIFFYVFFINGIALFILNAFPIYIKNITNDGMNVRNLKHNDNLRISFFKQLTIYSKLCNAADFDDISMEYLSIPQEQNETMGIHFYLTRIRYIKLLKQGDYAAINELLTKAEDRYEELDPRNRYFIDVERLFYLLVTKADVRVIKTYYKYLKNKMMGKEKNIEALRTLVLYEQMIHLDHKKAAKYSKQLVAVTRSTLIPQEGKLMVDVLKKVLEEEKENIL